MKRFQVCAILGAALAVAGLNATAQAQQPGGQCETCNTDAASGHRATAPAPQYGSVNMKFYPIPYQDGRHGHHEHDYTHYDHVPPHPGAYSHAAQRPHYPYLNAALYSSPLPNVPARVGGTVVTNQAFAPHEMLYPHSYKALYGPFSYRVQGDWHVTPFGVWSTEHWKLQGTEVSVKYKSRIPLRAGFFPPSGR